MVYRRLQAKPSAADKNVRGAAARKAYFPKRDRSVEEGVPSGEPVLERGDERDGGGGKKVGRALRNLI